MNVNRIEVGDIIDVEFGMIQYIFGVTVLCLPCQGEEYFILKGNDNMIFYVREFAKMKLRTKKDHVGTRPLEDYTREKYQESKKDSQ